MTPYAVLWDLGRLVPGFWTAHWKPSDAGNRSTVGTSSSSLSQVVLLWKSHILWEKRAQNREQNSFQLCTWPTIRYSSFDLFQKMAACTYRTEFHPYVSSGIWWGAFYRNNRLQYPLQIQRIHIYCSWKDSLYSLPLDNSLVGDTYPYTSKNASRFG